MIIILLAAALVAVPPATSEVPAISPAVAAALRAAATAGLETSRQTLTELGRRGDASAWEALGELLGASGGPTARAAMCDAYEQAASTRVDAAFNLASCHFFGDGRPRNVTLAERWYEKAIEGGMIKARCALGNLLIDKGNAADGARGLALCLSGAEAGSRDAQTDYGQFLLTGRGLARDPVAARLWFIRAAEQGQANAAFLLGSIYWNGDGTSKDNAAAAAAWRQAYKGGRHDAALPLARAAMVQTIPAHGLKSVDWAAVNEALEWFDIAAAQTLTAGDRAQVDEGYRLLNDLKAARPR